MHAIAWCCLSEPLSDIHCVVYHVYAVNINCTDRPIHTPIFITIELHDIYTALCLQLFRKAVTWHTLARSCSVRIEVFAWIVRVAMYTWTSLMAAVMTTMCFTSEGIEFTCSPKDALATEGSYAVFCCRYIGTSDLPLLRINSTIYRPTNLPLNHYYTRNGELLVYNIGRSMNGTTYSCVHVDYDVDTGTELIIESCKATLLVTESATEGSDQCCSEDNKCEDTASSPAPTTVVIDISGSQSAPVLSSTSLLLIPVYAMTVL